MVDRDLHDQVITIGFLTDETHEKDQMMKDNFDIVCEMTDNDYVDIKDILFK